jgi:hypothetical protein
MDNLGAHACELNGGARLGPDQHSFDRPLWRELVALDG